MTVTDKLDVPVCFLYTVSMKKIEKIFTKCGFRHEQVKRNGDIALFKRTQIGSGARPHFEVVRLSSHGGYEINGSYVKSAEIYPGPSLWGVRGWTYCDIESATSKYNSLLKKWAGKKILV